MRLLSLLLLIFVAKPALAAEGLTDKLVTEPEVASGRTYLCLASRNSGVNEKVVFNLRRDANDVLLFDYSGKTFYQKGSLERRGVGVDGKPYAIHGFSNSAHGMGSEEILLAHFNQPKLNKYMVTIEVHYLDSDLPPKTGICRSM